MLKGVSNRSSDMKVGEQTTKEHYPIMKKQRETPYLKSQVELTKKQSHKIRKGMLKFVEHKKLSNGMQ